MLSGDCNKPCLLLTMRAFRALRSSLSRRPYTSQSKHVVFPDPHRPDLFYHLLNPPTPFAHTLPAFGLSFLYDRPPSVDATDIIGWLPAQIAESASDSEAHTDVEEGHEEHSTLQDFVHFFSSIPAQGVLHSQVRFIPPQGHPDGINGGDRRRLERHRSTIAAWLDAHPWSVR
jgi:hypothetical protein